MNDPNKRLALFFLAQLLSRQIHHATPDLKNLSSIITEIVDQTLTARALAETLPINPIKDVPEYSNRIPSTLSLSFNANHQLISMNPNGVPWVNTTEPYTGKELLRNVDDVRKFYSVSDSKGKPLERSELGAPFLDVTTNPLNNLLNERNGDFLYKSDHHYPNTERKIELPELIIITIVDSHRDQTTGETIITPSKRAYILKLKESALNQAPLQGREIIDSAINLAQQGRDIIHPTVPDLHAKVLK